MRKILLENGFIKSRKRGGNVLESYYNPELRIFVARLRDRSWKVGGFGYEGISMVEEWKKKVTSFSKSKNRSGL